MKKLILSTLFLCVAPFYSFSLVVSDNLEQQSAPFGTSVSLPSGGSIDLDGVGFVASDSSVCTGSLVSDSFVITAAHCVVDTLDPSTLSVDFAPGETIEGTQTVYSVSEVFIHPNYESLILDNESELDINDLALLELQNPATNLPEYSLASEAATFPESALLVGYGLTGVGDTGSEPDTAGEKHWGVNEFDGLAENIFNNFPETAPENTQGILDFDNGTVAQNFIGNLGQGAQEALGNSGDSGGPLFNESGELTAIFSYLSSSPNDIDAIRNASFGEINGVTLLDPYNEWIQETIAPIPEPWSAMVIMPGFAAILVFLKKRRKL